MTDNNTSRLLAALPPPGKSVTVAAAAARSGLARKDVARKLGRLLERRLVIKESTGVYRLSPAGLSAREQGTSSQRGPRGPHTGLQAPPADSLRVRVWRALRASDKPTIADLLVLAAAGGERAAHGNAYRYIRALERAGYVRRLRIRQPGTALTSPGLLRWTLVRDTGRHAPVVRTRRGVVHDRNTDQLHPMEDGA